ncbi:MAG: heme biosynthesis protein HemY, partial [Methylocella sp.]
LKPGDGPEARFERVRDFVGESAVGVEGAYALTRAAVLAQRWDVARKTLEPHLAERPQARFCALMADIEEAQGDKGRAREWLARAVKAPSDPMWVSDGVASPRWTPVSPVSGEIVPCEWKSPFEMPAEENRFTGTAPAAAITSAKPEAKPVEMPRTVEYVRPPDDPGPEMDARRAVVTDG